MAGKNSKNSLAQGTKKTDNKKSSRRNSMANEKGFVNKLDEFIQWLNEAMETTENWTPPKAETDGLKLYLETHLVGKIVAVSNQRILMYCLLVGNINFIYQKSLYANEWLNEAMETTENWTPPKAETDGLKLYLETHLSFKLNVDSHCALKEAVEEEGHQLLELIASHKAGLKDMLRMIASQWKELQRQIKRQHSWILRALDTIKAEILATDVSVQDEEGTGSPKVSGLKSALFPLISVFF
ncbi:PREDICTED: uncharacterized protein LOC103608926 [Galeopterus variegatus]|uniref:Uncharacterized protein LOC103608926 n=1 Tax=Galeopterus variegatus TaxID=482537 RepID=A0ABM0SF93_GALVR|nr:PREDICTED: uncharacterized protein LOC103608926 [Galeopterus variegatus]